jgi:hypothetical protein
MRGVLGLRVDARRYGHVLRRILRRFFKVLFRGNTERLFSSLSKSESLCYKMLQVLTSCE